jgi:hypothetical protein
MNAEEAERKREQDEVKLYCDRLLRTAAVKEVYPTPVDKLVEAAELVKSGDLALLEIKEEVFPQRLFRKLKSSLSDLISLVKAGLFPKEKTIFINPGTHASSIPFVTLHECVHNILPWQKKTFIYLDDEKTLDPEARFRFEREANFGASYLLWQGEDYVKKSLDLPINVATPISLAKLFGGSIHSSMRYYVENHRAPIGLLVFQRTNDGVAPANLFNRHQLRYFSASAKFKERFGLQGFTLGKTDINILLTRPRELDLYWNGEIILDINNDSVLFEYSGCETPYNIFIILVQTNSARRYGKPIVIIEYSTRNNYF